MLLCNKRALQSYNHRISFQENSGTFSIRIDTFALPSHVIHSMLPRKAELFSLIHTFIWSTISIKIIVNGIIYRIIICISIKYHVQSWHLTAVNTIHERKYSSGSILYIHMHLHQWDNEKKCPLRILKERHRHWDPYRQPNFSLEKIHGQQLLILSYIKPNSLISLTFKISLHLHSNHNITKMPLWASEKYRY